MDRIVCAFVARYELSLRARTEPGLWSKPIAIADVAQSQGRITEVTPLAERHGARAGERLSTARAICPELEILPPDDALRAAAEREILSALGKLAPLLDSDGHGAFFLGLAGMARLVSDERAFAESVRRAMQSLGLSTGVAVADTPFVAWVASRRCAPQKAARIAPGESVRFLSQVPVGELTLPVRALELFELLGLRTAGALATLPAGALAQRLGADGLWLEKLLRGEGWVAWPTAGKVPEVPEEVSLELDGPTEGLEPILFLAKSLLDRLLAALVQSRRALAELAIEVRLDDRTTVRHALTPSGPTLNALGMMDLLRLWLDAQPFSAPVVGLRFWAARTGGATAHQLSLFQQREEHDRASLERAVSRLTAAFGAAAVVRPTLANTFRPEARVRWTGSQATTGDVSPIPECAESAIRFHFHSACGPPHLALRLLEPPEPVTWQRGGVLQRPGHLPIVARTVDGPHSISGEWWAEPFERSYSWLAGAEGELLWVFQDANGKLFLQAIGD